MGSKIEVPVFVSTNLDTQIAIAVPHDITTQDFKRELEKAHIESFPELGILTIYMAMVKQKSNFYCLPDFLPLKHAYRGCNDVWFVHVNAYTSNKLANFRGRASSSLFNGRTKVSKKRASTKIKQRKLRGLWRLKSFILGLVSAAYSYRKKKSKNRRKPLKKIPAGSSSETVGQAYKEDVKDQKEKLNTTCASDSFSESVSVSGIIERYFLKLIVLEQELDQIDSPWSSEQNQLKDQETDAESKSFNVLRAKKKLHTHETTPRLLPLPESSNFVGLKNKYERSEVGERLVVASNSLQLCESKQRSSRSNLCKGRKFLETDSGSITRSLVFEIGDDD